MSDSTDNVIKQPAQNESPNMAQTKESTNATPDTPPSSAKSQQGENDTSHPAEEQRPTQQSDDASSMESSSQDKSPSSSTAKIGNSCEGSLDLKINDWHGHPIPNLELKVLQNKKAVFQGKTDAEGTIPTITGLKVNSTFEIHVKKDSGEYKFAALGKVYGEENYACLQSPKTRFEFSTEPHQGSPGNAEQRKEKTIQSHNQKPAARPEITGNPDKKPVAETGRDKNGNPKAFIVDGLRNWYNRNANNAGGPTAGITDIERVQRLIEFAQKQAEWAYQDKTTTDEYIKKMHDKTFVEPGKKARTESKHMCNKYVKIALWYAYHEGEDIKPVGSGISPAREMGPALLKAGFKDITKQLPDARWAAPGDVIVYQSRKNPQSSGHIDIRTYDGYISDFFTERLPVRGFRVTGIYRKCYDPMPEKRMRAFLKVLREWECHEELNDERRYYLLQQPINGSRRFSDTRTHPYSGTSSKATFAGAYQIRLGSWEDACKRGEMPSDFSPLTQDRIAIWKCEDRNNALSLIRLNKIDEAIPLLTSEWTSLPGGVHARKGRMENKNYVYTMDDLLKAYKGFLDEQT